MGFVIKNKTLEKYVPDSPEETEVVVPEGITKIEHGAFWNKTQLVSVKLPESLTEIDYHAFNGCKNLVNINIPKGVVRIGQDAFSGTAIYRTLLYKEESKLFGENNKFYGSTVIIDNALIKVVLKEELQKIGHTHKREEREYVIPEHITCIADYAFYNTAKKNTDKLVSIRLPEGIKKIGKHTFEGCYDLLSIEIPDSVETIGNGAFRGCKNLKSVKLSNNLKSMTDSFVDCKNLKTITLPESLEKIDGTFQGCTSLSSVVIHETVTYVGLNTFKDCTKLKNVTFNCLTTMINSDTFRNTPWFDSLDRQNGFIIHDGLLFCPVSKYEGDLIIPDGVKAIAGNSFMYMDITSLTIPEGVEVIGDMAFYECKKLKEVKFPSTIRRIGQCVFLHDTSISKVECADSPYLILVGNKLYKKESRKVKIIDLVE